MNIPKCPICLVEATEVTGKHIYPRRSDLFSLKFYQCMSHTDYYVGCHKKDGRPLGVLADKEHRVLKMQCHGYFDPHWMVGFRPRSEFATLRKECYARLANDMGLAIDQTHFGMFTKDQCKQALEILKKW